MNYTTFTAEHKRKTQASMCLNNYHICIHKALACERTFCFVLFYRSISIDVHNLHFYEYLLAHKMYFKDTSELKVVPLLIFTSISSRFFNIHLIFNILMYES